MNRSFRPVWFILFVVAGLSAIVGISRMQETRADENERIPWTHDLAAARKQSVKENRPILIYFTAKWCEPCQRMKKTTWADEHVAIAVSKYIPVKIDVDDQRDIAREFGVEGYPRVERIEPTGERRLLTDGLMTPEEFLKVLGAI